ncbi:MAG: hypothetical protein E5Y82_02065 [Mesorhizobium sp.]|nr:MAG: hypothetical protein E5Y82_02065 [Mesorhizobium sp.]
MSWPRASKQRRTGKFCTSSAAELLRASYSPRRCHSAKRLVWQLKSARSCDRHPPFAHARHLAGFSGILQVDGYSAYTNLVKARDKAGSNETIRLAGCWAHLRRKFYDLHISGISQGRDGFDHRHDRIVEGRDKVRGKDAGSRAALRQEKSVAICREPLRSMGSGTGQGLGEIQNRLAGLTFHLVRG